VCVLCVLVVKRGGRGAAEGLLEKGWGRRWTDGGREKGKLTQYTIREENRDTFFTGNTLFE